MPRTNLVNEGFPDTELPAKLTLSTPAFVLLVRHQATPKTRPLSVKVADRRIPRVIECTFVHVGVPVVNANSNFPRCGEVKFPSAADGSRPAR